LKEPLNILTMEINTVANLVLLPAGVTAEDCK